MRNVVNHVVDALVFRADGAGRVDDVNDNIDAFDGVADFVVEILDEPVRLRLEQARRVDEDDLARRPVDDAVIGVAGGLRFGRDDGDLGADERVQQRGFANVCTTDEDSKTGFQIRRRIHCCGIVTQPTGFVDFMTCARS